MTDSFYSALPKHGEMCCRFTVDDNIRFLENLTKNSSCKSIFENEYLAMFRRFHDKYGLKVTFNLFYSYYPGSFSLDDMTERFKAEFSENADWLRFSFHARHNDPEYPYENAGKDTLLRDFDDVTENIIRFAGKECVSNFITIHYLLAGGDSSLALRGRSVKGFMGFPAVRNGKNTFTAYLSESQIETAVKNSVSFDSKTGLFFITNDMIINTVPLGKIKAKLNDAIGRGTKFIDLMIHEQYFYPDYENYQPDFEEKLDTAFSFLIDRGYRFVLADEIL